MTTFTKDGNTYNITLVSPDQKYVYGKKVIDGKTGKGRPSKFRIEDVNLDGPLPELRSELSAQKKTEPAVEKETKESSTTETQLSLNLEQNAQREAETNQNFLKLD